ncbi:kinase-like protein, partial [Trametopsis cervina]
DLLSLERRNLAMIDWNPFVAGLFNCLQDSKNVYQLMELGHCGTLSALIKKTKGGLPTSVCRFYMANLVAALEFIHSLGLVHSDLKPGNIVIGADGYLMICDLGVSAFEHEERDWNDVGTTMYAPPDCIKGNMPPPGRRSMDVWAVGCILFEMATGRAVKTQSKPRRIELLNRVGSARWFWPRGMVVDETLKDMVNKMLAKEISERLGAIYTPGSRKNDELRAHPFLRKFPWHQLNNRTLVVS